MICEHCTGETPNGDPRDRYCTICKADPDCPEWEAEKEAAADNERQHNELGEVK